MALLQICLGSDLIQPRLDPPSGYASIRNSTLCQFSIALINVGFASRASTAKERVLLKHLGQITNGGIKVHDRQWKDSTETSGRSRPFGTVASRF